MLACCRHTSMAAATAIQRVWQRTTGFGIDFSACWVAGLVCAYVRGILSHSQQCCHSLGAVLPLYSALTARHREQKCAFSSQQRSR